MKVCKNTNMNKYIIQRVKGKKPPYRSIYSLRSVELETLITYIEIYLKTGFIKFFKFQVSVHNLFDQKPNKNLYLYANDQSLNNLTIKN